MNGDPGSAAVVVEAARVMVRDSGVDEASQEYRRWRSQVRGAGFCHHPVRMSGQRYRDHSTGREVLFSTEGEPERALLIRCGNRRSSLCPPCSRESKGDVSHLHAGTAGGTKGVPETVATHPMWFVMRGESSSTASQARSCFPRCSRWSDRLV